jgi:UDP-N-acetylglucosamine acyltransferase
MGINPTAIIDPSAELAAGVEIGPYVIIEGGTRLGAGCEIRSHAVVLRGSLLGANNVVHEGAVIGGEPQDIGFVECDSRIEIGARNRIREGVTIHRASKAGTATIIGSDCFLMAYSHVAHDCRLGDNVILANNALLAGHVQVGDRAFVSGGVVVHQFCRIGRLAMISGNAKIPQDCLPFVLHEGSTARAAGLNVVGLRRAGYGADDRRALKEAYRILLEEGLPLDAACAKMETIRNPLVDEMIAFARSTKRGFCRARRRELD